jgi:hypothetical protein
MTEKETCTQLLIKKVQTMAVNYKAKNLTKEENLATVKNLIALFYVGPVDPVTTNLVIEKLVSAQYR